MRYLIVSVLGAALFAPLLTGCTTDHEKSTSHNPITGTTTEKDTTSTQSN